MLSEKAFRYITVPPKRFNILHGSVRSGKTVSSMMVLPDRVKRAPHGDIVLTGKTERTVYRNVIRPLQLMFGEGRIKYSKGMGEGRIGKRDFYVIGGSNEASVTKAQGLTVAYWYGDEAVTYPGTFLDMMVTRLSPEGACSDWTMNPGGPYHEIKTNFIDKADDADLKDQIAVHHFTLSDNLNLTAEFVRSLMALYPASSLFYKRYILGLWVFAEGAIYDFFDETLHRLDFDLAAQHPPDFWTLSGDYGTGNATSVGLYAHWNKPVYENVKVMRVRAYYYSGRDTGRQKTDDDYATDMQLEFGDRKDALRHFILDPSAASFKAKLRDDKWPVEDAKNDVLDGLRTQARMLKAGEYVIGPDASNDQCVQDYSAYLWDKRAQERGEDKPLKQHDHTKDEERYDLLTMYPLEEIVAPPNRRSSVRTGSSY
jgi:PBSX family phage terminase large subunit